jgi:hypothetical protein
MCIVTYACVCLHVCLHVYDNVLDLVVFFLRRPWAILSPHLRYLYIYIYIHVFFKVYEYVPRKVCIYHPMHVDEICYNVLHHSVNIGKNCSLF